MTKLRPVAEAPGRPGGSAVFSKSRLRLYSPRLMGALVVARISVAALAEWARACKHSRMADAESKPAHDAPDDAADVGDEGAEEEWPEGLVAVGGDLDPDTLVRAYRAGIFPWSSQPAVTWWSPDPRAVFDLVSFR